jgi:hypothetical protein
MNSKSLVERAAFDLYLWRRGGSDHFTVQLYQLMQKADQDNLHKLGMVFPTEHAIFQAWKKAPSEEQYFESIGIGRA